MLIVVMFAGLRVPGQQPAGPSIRDFLGRTYFQEIEASPDSKHVAFLTTNFNFATDKKEWTVWNLQVDQIPSKTALTKVTMSNGAISTLKWSSDGRYLGYKIAQAELPSRLSLFDASTSKVINITDEKSSKNGVSFFNWSADGKHLFFAVDDTPALPKDSPVTFPPREDPEDHSTFYRVATAGIRRKPQVYLSLDFQIPPEFVVLPGESKVVYSMGRSIFLVDINDAKNPKRLSPVLLCTLGLRSVPKGLLFQSCAGVPSGNLTPNAQAIRTQRRQYLLDPHTGHLEQLAQDYQGELWSRGLTPDGQLLAIGLNSTKWTLYKINPESKRREAIETPAVGISHISVSGNGKTVAFASILDGEIYIANGLDHLRTAQKVTDFNTTYNKQPKAEKRTIKWSNGEGNEIEGVLYFPPGKTDAKGLPAVVIIHGGPWMARSDPYYAPLAGSTVDYGLMLASRGYLVLAPNYRGSPGRGDAFLSALDGYPCSRPVADILPGVDLLIANGWADPNRLGVTGASYGGLATNCIIGRTTRFRAAVTSASYWNFTSSFSDSPGLVAAVKPPWDDMRLFWEEAPISKAGNIRTPTLIIHGEADATVNVSQAREISRALSVLGVPNQLLIFPKEGHGFSTPSNDVTQLKALITWFDHYLLGIPMAQTRH